MAEATKTSTTYCGETITTQQIRENVLGVDASRLLRQLTEANPTVARTKAALLIEQLRELGLINDEDNNQRETTTSYKTRTSSSNTTTSSRNEDSELADYIMNLYRRYIGKRPSEAIVADISELINDGFDAREKWRYVMQETGSAPYPSWRYASAIIRRIRMYGMDE